MELLLRLAPLPSAGTWLPHFAVFRKLVWPSHTLFSAIDIARTHGHCWLGRRFVCKDAAIVFHLFFVQKHSEEVPTYR